MIKEGILNFKYFNSDIESYSFFRRLEVVVGKKVRQQNCCTYVFFYSSHRFLTRVQRPTCTIYGKFLLESIMALLTPQSGIVTFMNMPSIFTFHISCTASGIIDRSRKLLTMFQHIIMLCLC